MDVLKNAGYVQYKSPADKNADVSGRDFEKIEEKAKAIYMALLHI